MCAKKTPISMSSFLCFPPPSPQVNVVGYPRGVRDGAEKTPTRTRARGAIRSTLNSGCGVAISFRVRVSRDGRFFAHTGMDLDYIYRPARVMQACTDLRIHAHLQSRCSCLHTCSVSWCMRRVRSVTFIRHKSRFNLDNVCVVGVAAMVKKRAHISAEERDELGWGLG